jgi:hypothetical protein
MRVIYDSRIRNNYLSHGFFNLIVETGFFV